MTARLFSNKARPQQTTPPPPLLPPWARNATQPKPRILPPSPKFTASNKFPSVAAIHLNTLVSYQSLRKSSSFKAQPILTCWEQNPPPSPKESSHRPFSRRSSPFRRRPLLRIKAGIFSKVTGRTFLLHSSNRSCPNTKQLLLLSRCSTISLKDGGRNYQVRIYPHPNPTYTVACPILAPAARTCCVLGFLHVTATAIAHASPLNPPPRPCCTRLASMPSNVMVLALLQTGQFPRPQEIINNSNFSNDAR